MKTFKQSKFLRIFRKNLDVAKYKQLSKNMTIYKDLNKISDYDNIFSKWNKSNLILWNYKDILCRLGMDND